MTENAENNTPPESNTTEQPVPSENKPNDPRGEAIKTEIVELLNAAQGVWKDAYQSQVRLTKMVDQLQEEISDIKSYSAPPSYPAGMKTLNSSLERIKNCKKRITQISNRLNRVSNTLQQQEQQRIRLQQKQQQLQQQQEKQKQQQEQAQQQQMQHQQNEVQQEQDQQAVSEPEEAKATPELSNSQVPGQQSVDQQQVPKENDSK